MNVDILSFVIIIVITVDYIEELRSGAAVREPNFSLCIANMAMTIGIDEEKEGERECVVRGRPNAKLLSLFI